MTPAQQTQRGPFPDNRDFAFTIIDDTDLATVNSVGPVYGLLHELGLRTTKTVWVKRSSDPDSFAARSQTLEDKDYLEFVLELQRQGFEIAMHLASPGSSRRQETISAYNTFKEVIGHDPKININHASNAECIYWGRDRIDGALWQTLYDRLAGTQRFWGHVQDSEFFWGDICQETTKYVRGFTFRGINTLKIDPAMPYHDIHRPYVNYWFSASDGADVARFNKLLSEENQARLVREKGCCIVYTHFGKGFVHGGEVNTRTEQLLRLLAQKGGWYVPVSELLDFLLTKQCNRPAPRTMRLLQCCWILEQVFDRAVSRLKRAYKGPP